MYDKLKALVEDARNKGDNIKLAYIAMHLDVKLFTVVEDRDRLFKLFYELESELTERNIYFLFYNYENVEYKDVDLLFEQNQYVKK